MSEIEQLQKRVKILEDVIVAMCRGNQFAIGRTPDGLQLVLGHGTLFDDKTEMWHAWVRPRGTQQR